MPEPTNQLVTLIIGRWMNRVCVLRLPNYPGNWKFCLKQKKNGRWLQSPTFFFFKFLSITPITNLERHLKNILSVGRLKSYSFESTKIGSWKLRPIKREHSYKNQVVSPPILILLEWSHIYFCYKNKVGFLAGKTCFLQEFFFFFVMWGE